MQKNGFDCGVFICQASCYTELVQGDKTDFTQVKVRNFIINNHLHYITHCKEISCWMKYLVANYCMRSYTEFIYVTHFIGIPRLKPMGGHNQCIILSLRNTFI